MPATPAYASAPPPPELLLERYLSGDDEAFGALTARYETPLYAFLFRMTGNRHLAEDVFRQTFVKIAKNAAAFDSGSASFSTWLYRAARNSALDELRRRARRMGGLAGTTGYPSESALTPPEQTAPLDAQSASEAAARVRELLAGVPEEQREAFLLKEEAGLDFAQIGVVLGCGKEAAKSRFRLAARTLRTLFDRSTGRQST